ncbi:MFS transporter [Corynebacterium timonense]|uniref:MFS transporter, DHA2 family, multidrug resistance protein n=1 Tax=Corynebacterium timonense TaxID=441500 RepID=A0A1H1LCV2_9CORY|nr:MFS transporter [Corynebacterium timonense]SDR72421.1 MFS transporter, DHA2 family, multidrug resistance protein [Corynebacterium timonense]
MSTTNDNRPRAGTHTGRPDPATYRGDDILLLGLVLSVSTFWLFAQTANINGPRILADLGLNETVLSSGVAASGVVCGMIIALAGSIADRNGHVRMVVAGNIVNIVGSLLVALAPTGALATPFFLSGRILQGAAAALIMPATLTLVRTYWEGTDRHRAISMWSLGSFGASGVTSLFGGLLEQTFVGWRGIFLIGVLVSVAGIILVRRAPETQTPRSGVRGLDWAGAITFALGIAAVFILVTQASKLDFSTAIPWVLLVGAIVIFVIFGVVEKSKGSKAFLDFALFKNRQYSSVVTTNFLLNSMGGSLVVSLWVLQSGYGLEPGTVGLLTLGFAAGIFTFLRVGEKLLGAKGAKFPILIAAVTVPLSMVFFAFTFLPRTEYMILNVVASFAIGAGLALFATPGTDAALSALPADKVGVGSGFYKMASALGNGFGIAIFAALFTSQTNGGPLADFVGQLVPFAADGEVVVRQAAAVALGFGAIYGLVAFIFIALWVPGRPAASQDKEVPQKVEDEVEASNP